MPSPNLMAATLARETTDARIVVMGNSVALYNPPTRVAEEMAMLDVLSGGRLVSGFPVDRGWDLAGLFDPDPDAAANILRQDPMYPVKILSCYADSQQPCLMPTGSWPHAQ